MIEDYEIIDHIGGGKDGKVYIAKFCDKKFILKQLTSYSKSFLFMTRYYIDAGVESPHLYKLNLIDKNYWVYAYESLKNVDSLDVGILYQICEAQKHLIPHNLVMWDFGINHKNYMINENGVLKWIDYGGNNFLYIKKPAGKKIIFPGNNRNLIIAKNDFIQMQLLFHICLYKYGFKKYAKYSILIKKTKEPLEKIKQRISSELKDSEAFIWVDKIFRENLLSVSGWLNLQKEIKLCI
jgi:hypothetical protein